MEWIILSVGGINSLLTIYSYKNIPPSNFIKKYFLYFLIITSLWIFSNFILRLYTNFFWFKMSYAMGSIIAPVALILVISFSIQKKLSNTFLFVMTFIAILLFISSLIDNVFFIKNNYPNNNAGYTLLFFIYPIFLSISLLYCIYKLILCIKKFKGIFKLQAFYIFLGLLLFGIFTLIVTFILPILGFSEFAKLDTCGSLFFVAFTLYAIIRYNLMEINLKITKSTIHTLIISIITIAYVTIIIFFFENKIEYLFEYNIIILRVIGGTFIALTFLPIYNIIKNITDKFLFYKQFNNILFLGKKYNQNIHNIKKINLLNEIVNKAAITLVNTTNYNKLKKIYSGIIKSLIKAIESKDKYSHGHSYRVVDIAAKIGIEYGLSSEQIELIKYASVLHDIGRIGIPNNILNKPDKLTKKETDEIRKYPKIGSDIISSIEYFDEAGNIILHQHERWDGKGYPDNLKSEQIPLISRIIFIADAFDAMTSNRPFRIALSKKAAIKEIKNESGKQFDPSVVRIFLSIYNKKIH